MALALFMILTVFGMVAAAGLHILSVAVGFWSYVLLCFGGGSLMIGAVWVWEQFTADRDGAERHPGQQ
jgi:hypothetical protein